MAVHAINSHLESEEEEAGFFRSLSETVARLVHAERVAFWRLDKNDVMSIQPDPFGFPSSRAIYGLVEDDCVGFDTEASEPRPGHLGLVSMRERVERPGGRLRIDSSPGTGTRVEFWIPGEPFP